MVRKMHAVIPSFSFPSFFSSSSWTESFRPWVTKPAGIIFEYKGRDGDTSESQERLILCFVRNIHALSLSLSLSLSEQHERNKRRQAATTTTRYIVKTIMASFIFVFVDPSFYYC
jgi:hypothetical protein